MVKVGSRVDGLAYQRERSVCPVERVLGHFETGRCLGPNYRTLCKKFFVANGFSENLPICVLVSKSLDNRVLYRDESKTGLLSTDDFAAAETAL